jgi:hypothetical protein
MGLVTKYPQLFNNALDSDYIFKPTWMDLLDDLCQAVSDQLRTNYIESFKFTRITVKNNGMRIEHDGGDMYVGGMIDIIERQSKKC